MTWFKVDDSFYDHEKVEQLHYNAPKLAAAALGLWLMAGCWSSKQLTDGKIPRPKVLRLGSTYSAADALVECGLWEKTDTGYQFHDWADRNPTREQVHARRDADAARKAVARGIRAQTSTESDGTPKGVVSTRPDPTPPNPTQTRPTGTTRAPDSRGATRLREADPSPSDIREAEGAQAMRDGTPGGLWQDVIRRCGELTPPGVVRMRLSRKPPPGLVDRLEESSVGDVLRICGQFADLCREDPTAKLVPGDKRDGGGTVLEFWGPGRLWLPNVWEAVKALLVRQGGGAAADVSAEPSEGSLRLLARADPKRAGGAR